MVHRCVQPRLCQLTFAHYPLFYVAAGLFFLTAVVNFFADNLAQGAVFTALGAAFVAIGSSYRNKPTSATPIELSETQQLEVQTLVAKGKKVEAIKRVRQETGAGLGEAKTYVDRVEARAAK